MEQELKDFDSRITKPLPPLIQQWRDRWVKMIEKQKLNEKKWKRK